MSLNRIRIALEKNLVSEAARHNLARGLLKEGPIFGSGVCAFTLGSVGAYKGAAETWKECKNAEWLPTILHKVAFTMVGAMSSGIPEALTGGLAGAGIGFAAAVPLAMGVKALGLFKHSRSALLIATGLPSQKFDHPGLTR